MQPGTVSTWIAAIGFFPVLACTVPTSHRTAGPDAASTKADASALADGGGFPEEGGGTSTPDAGITDGSSFSLVDATPKAPIDASETDGGERVVDAGSPSAPLLGANVHSLWNSVTPAMMVEELATLQAAGANIARVDVDWSSIEYASKGQYDPTQLGRLDAFVAQAASDGLSILATLASTPAWASDAGTWNQPPRDPADFGDFAHFLTARYGHQLAAVEVWNEPEINDNLIATDLPATYASLVRAVYVGAKSGSPDVLVVAGALSYADVSFLSALYANGIQGFFDGISLHPYADGAAPGNTSVNHSFIGGIQALHAAQIAAGDATPEWVTEFGWPVGTSAGANTEVEQAQYVESAFALIRGLPFVRAAAVYQLRDMGTDPANAEDNFGLLEQDFSPRPALAAFTSAMK